MGPCRNCSCRDKLLVSEGLHVHLVEALKTFCCQCYARAFDTRVAVGCCGTEPTGNPACRGGPHFASRRNDTSYSPGKNDFAKGCAERPAHRGKNGTGRSFSQRGRYSGAVPRAWFDCI